MDYISYFVGAVIFSLTSIFWLLSSLFSGDDRADFRARIVCFLTSLSFAYLAYAMFYHVINY